MRQLNVHYARGLREPALDGLPGHRRRADHRPQATPEGFETITADQACQERSLQAADRSDTLTPVYRNLGKLTIIKLCGI
jgi:hypothetical protein